MVMKVIKLSLNDVITMKEDVSCCIGYFDGLHLGHQKLINSAKEFAQKQGIASGLITFDPDPVSVIRDLEEEKKLQNKERKLQEAMLSIQGRYGKNK